MHLLHVIGGLDLFKICKDNTALIDSETGRRFISLKPTVLQILEIEIKTQLFLLVY